MTKPKKETPTQRDKALARLAKQDTPAPQPVSIYLKGIARQLMEDSGYPYPPDSTVDPALALSYGYAAGLVMGGAKVWEEIEKVDEKGVADVE